MMQMAKLLLEIEIQMKSKNFHSHDLLGSLKEFIIIPFYAYILNVPHVLKPVIKEG